MRSKLILPAILLTAAIGIPAAVLAGDDDFRSNRLNVPQDRWLSPTQVTEKLDQKGYKVTEIEIDDGSYEVEMTDRNGVRVEGRVHPETGELLLGFTTTTTNPNYRDMTALRRAAERASNASHVRPSTATSMPTPALAC